MSFSIQATIRALVAPKHRLSCSRALWQEGLNELRRRGGGYRESGAFLLGASNGLRRRIEQFVYYDDLDPRCLKTGIVIFDGAHFPRLWRLCRETGRGVVADVHTHPGRAWQSSSDRQNPMIAAPGHIAIIVPDFAAHCASPDELGIYQYLGEHHWSAYTDRDAARFFYLGRWI